VPPIIYYETYNLNAGIYFANGYEYVPEYIVPVYTYTYTTTRTSTASTPSKPFNPDIYWDEYDQPQATITATSFNPDRYWDEYDMPVQEASVNWLGTTIGVLGIGTLGLITAIGVVKRKLSPITAEADDEEPSQGYYAGGWGPGGAGGGMTAAEDGQWSQVPDAETKAEADADNARLSQAASNWGKGSYDSPEDSLINHYEKHKEEVGASSPEQYANKAKNFASNLKGATSKPVDGETPDVVRYYKNGKYIDIQKTTKKIISFGKK
jgi:hypothetical protein